MPFAVRLTPLFVARPINVLTLRVGTFTDITGNTLAKHIEIKTKKPLNRAQIQQYVHGAMNGPIGRKLHAANHLIEQGIANKIDINLDLAQMK